MNIITLTLNPAYDLHCEADNLRLYHENFVTLSRAEAGGKGVNLSRALLAGGVDSLCFVLTGEEDHASFCKALEQDGLRVKALSLPGKIRQNLTFHEKEKKETRISFPGFSVPRELLLRVKEAVGEVEEHTVITFTGSAPKGVEAEEVMAFLREFSCRGARLVLDSRLFSLSQMLSLKPFLVKPNGEEATLYWGKKVESIEDGAAFARVLHENGAEHAMVSLGPDGALLCCGEGCFHASTPDLPILSTIGAGDSALAGFLAGASAGLRPEDCLKRGVAFGTAACLTPGSQPPRSEDIRRVEKEITVRRL